MAFVSLNNGKLDAALNNARADGEAGQPGGVVDVEFLHEIIPMLFDSLRGNGEFYSSFLVSVAFSDQLKHFHFART